MKIERMILIAFLGNYLVNNVVAGLASLVPASQGGNPMLSGQYITFVILAAIMLAIMAWWYLRGSMGGLQQGAIFGIVGFVVAVATAFVTGISGVLLQTGSFAQVAAVLPNFGPYLISKTTLVLLVLWVLPAILVGWWMQRGSGAAPASRPSMGMSSGTM